MLWWLAQNALMAAVLAGLVALVCRLGRFGPAVRHALWLVVLIKLVTPPLVDWPWTLPDLRQSPPTEPAAVADAAAPREDALAALVELQAVLAADESSHVAELSFALPPTADREHKPPPNNPPESAAWLQWFWLAPGFLYVWLAGTGLVCLLQCVRITRFRRLLARAEPAPRWFLKPVESVAAKLRVRRPVTLIVPGIGSPFVWNLGRPKLLWPASLLERLPHNCQRSVIAHELAHLRRRDHWVGWLQLLAECLWWWNPLFWYVRRQLRLNAELACDAWVVSTLPDDRRAYAEALIEVTELISRTAAPVPALGMSSAARQDFERRLTMIMRDCVPCKVPLIGMVAIGLLSLLALPGWSQVQNKVLKAGEGKKDEKPAPKDVTFVEDILHLVDPKIVAVDEIGYQDLVAEIAAVDDKKTSGDTDRDRRLQKLEEQLQALLKEVQSLRGGGSKPQLLWSTKPGQPSDRPRVQIIERRRSEVKNEKPSGAGEGAKAAPQAGVRIYSAAQPHVEHLTETIRSLRDGKETIQVITLSRATYKLPHAKAEALASFLAEHGKVQVLETKVEGDSLIVTTTPEVQRAIQQFIAVIQGLTVTAVDPKTGKVLELLQHGSESPLQYRLYEGGKDARDKADQSFELFKKPKTDEKK